MNWSAVGQYVLNRHSKDAKRYNVTFQEWWQGILVRAKVRGLEWLIEEDKPDEYRDYFEDGDLPDQVLDAELRCAGY